MLMCVFVSTLLFAKANDVLVLNNEMMFKGTVKKINDCSVVFKTKKGKVEVPADAIHSIRFEDANNKLLVAYQNQNSDKCFKGTNDADNFHGKTGSHVAMGVLFGPFAIIGAALADPTPYKSNKTAMMSKNSEIFNDPVYLACYKKKAKAKNVISAAIGWGAWIILILAAGN